MNVMPLRSRLFSFLARELEALIPQFKPYTTDYHVVAYASKDLETWLKVKMGIEDAGLLYKRIEEMSRERPEDLKAMLSFWANIWLSKWQERVRIQPAKTEESKEHAEKIRRARRILQEMEWKDDLKNMVIRKLIECGEVCMTEFIAENLIVEEIARRLHRADDKSFVAPDPLSIYNAVSLRIMRLSREKGPLVYLNIKPGLFHHNY